MVVLWWRQFLMSQVPLYKHPTPQFLTFWKEIAQSIGPLTSNLIASSRILELSSCVDLIHFWLKTKGC